MEISCPDGGNGGRNNSSLATHEEIDPTGMISVVANLTPWSDHNQSPRNMYQCQVFTIIIFSGSCIQLSYSKLLFKSECNTDGETNHGILYSSTPIPC